MCVAGSQLFPELFNTVTVKLRLYPKWYFNPLSVLLLPAGRGDHGGREGHGDAEHLEDECAPRDGEGVEEAGGRRVGDLGDVGGAPRQPVEQPRVEGAEHGVAALRRLAQGRHFLQRPQQSEEVPIQ